MRGVRVRSSNSTISATAVGQGVGTLDCHREYRVALFNPVSVRHPGSSSKQIVGIRPDQTSRCQQAAGERNLAMITGGRNM